MKKKRTKMLKTEEGKCFKKLEWDSIRLNHKILGHPLPFH